MRERGNVSGAVGRATGVRARETRGACMGGTLKLAEELASRALGCAPMAAPCFIVPKKKKKQDRGSSKGTEKKNTKKNKREWRA